MLNDVRLAVRSLRGSSATLAAMLVLALGIGSSTAIYSIVDAVLLRPLPFDDPERLVAIVEAAPERSESVTQGLTTSQSFLDWRLRARSFDGMAAVATWSSRIGGVGPPFEVRALRTSHELFQLLRVTQAAGRLFQPDDERPGSDRIALVDHAFWQTRFGSLPTAVGSRITVDGEPRTIVGVLPPGFTFPLDGAGAAGVVVPATFSPDDRIRGTSESYRWRVIGRLRRDRTVDEAGEEMAAVWTALSHDHPGWSRGHRLRVLPLETQILGDTRDTLRLLFAGVGAVLFLTFGNIGLWMLARASARDIEWSIRSAIGASHWRLVRAMAVEGLLVGLAGAAAGIFVTHLISSVLLAALPPGLPRAAAIGVDGRVLAVTGLVCALLGAASGALAALVAMRADLARKLMTGDRTAGPHGNGARRFLIVGEIALATMVLSSAGLFIASFRAVMSVDLGVQYGHVLTLHVVPADAEAGMTAVEASTAARLRLRRYLDVATRLPDVSALGAVQGGLPLSGDRSGVRIQTHDGTSRFDGTADRRIVTPGYFDALGMRLIAGRWLADADAPGAPAVVLVNETAARRYWPDRDPVGARVQVGTSGETRTVIGVVANVRTLGPETPAPPELYVPAAQTPIDRKSVV